VGCCAIPPVPVNFFFTFEASENAAAYIEIWVLMHLLAVLI
jgi:hypothetical protein